MGGQGGGGNVPAPRFKLAPRFAPQPARGFFLGRPGMASLRPLPQNGPSPSKCAFSFAAALKRLFLCSLSGA